MKITSATITFEDTFEDADAVVDFIQSLGGHAYVSHLTQAVPGRGFAYQVNITTPSRVLWSRAGSVITFADGEFTVSHGRPHS